MNNNFTSTPIANSNKVSPSINIPKIPKKFFIPIIVIILIAVFYFRIFNKTSTLTFSGQASGVVKADWVTFVISKVDSSTSAVTAVESSQTSMENLTLYLKTLGTADADISKGVYQLTPQTDGKYLVVNTISVKYRNLDKVDNLIKGLYVNGATAISEMSYGVDDWSQIDGQVRADAIDDAKLKLNQTAKNLNKRPGRLVNIVDDTNNIISEIGSDGQPQLKLTKNIVVSYELR